MAESGYTDERAKGDAVEVERVIDTQLLIGAKEPFDPSPDMEFDDDDDDMVDDPSIDYLLGPAPVDHESTGGLPYLTPGQCADLPARDYVVKSLIAPGQIGCIFGEPGAGKSLIAPRIAYEIAQGEPSFGLRTKAGPVFYVACEDQEGMAGRVAALHIELGDADTFHLFNTVGDLFSPGAIKGKGSADLEALRNAAQQARPQLIVIDTLAMAMPGLEENDAAGMNRVVQIGKRLTKYGAAIIFVHHGTKAEGNTPTIQAVLNAYQGSPKYLDLADRTRKDYVRQIRQIESEFADFPLAALADRRTRGEFLAWRDKLAIKSRRQADYTFSTFAAIMAWACDRGLVSTNPCARPGKLYRSKRAESIWTADDEAALQAVAPPRI